MKRINKTLSMVLIALVLLFAASLQINRDLTEKTETIKAVNQELKERIQSNRAKIESIEIAITESKLALADQEEIMSQKNFDWFAENQEVLNSLLDGKGR